MKQFRWLSCGFMIAALGPGALLHADTVYQTSPQGKQVVIQRDAIVVKEDSNYLYYKHFDLKERRVEKVNLNKGSLPFQVSKTPAPNRQQIVDVWKRFGYQVTVTNHTGKSTQVFDAYLDFYPPAGRGSLLESVPARTSFPILIQGGSADEEEFSNIARIEFQGQQMRLTLRSGEVEVGTFLMPTQRPAEARLLGITDHYDPASADVFDFSGTLAGLKEIRFDNQ